MGHDVVHRRVSIKPYEPGFLDAAARVWFESFQSTALGRIDDVTEADLRARIPNEIDLGWEAYLAWDGGVLVGFLALKAEESRLHQLFVAPSAQGRGIGAQLLDFVKRRFPDGVWLSTDLANAGARRFYERHGFRSGETRLHPRHGSQIITYRWP